MDFSKEASVAVLVAALDAGIKPVCLKCGHRGVG